MNKIEKLEKDKVQRFLKGYSIFGIITSITVLILIVILSLLPSSKVPTTSWFPFEDKGAHMFAYTVFGACCFAAFSRLSFSMHKSSRDILDSNWSTLPTIFTLIIGLPVGIIIEFIQSHVGRSFEVLDIVADGLGLLVGCALSLFVLRLIISYISKNIIKLS